MNASFQDFHRALSELRNVVNGKDSSTPASESGVQTSSTSSSALVGGAAPDALQLAAVSLVFDAPASPAAVLSGMQMGVVAEL